MQQGEGERSSDIRSRVIAAHGLQLARQGKANSRLGEQPTRLRILRGESPLTVSYPKRTVSISEQPARLRI